MRRSAILLLAGLLGESAALRVHSVAHSVARASSAGSVARPRALSMSEIEQPEKPAVEPEAPAVKTGKSDMPTSFLGVFDVTTTTGSLGASLVVAAGFGLLVEFIKFADPNSASPSIFGSAWS